jgi:glutamine amidotransferase
MIVIIDYGSGNVKSVYNALRVIDGDVKISNREQDLRDATHLVLPGVGAFAKCINGLNEIAIVDLLQREVIEKGKPFLGICVGLQALATWGLEFGQHAGLNWIPGRVDLIDTNGSGFRLPQIGWNELNIRTAQPLFRGIEPGATFYFVHSFHLIPDDPSVISATTDHGVPVTASVQRDNIFGVQFHPEKSQTVGIKLLENFLKVR